MISGVYAELSAYTLLFCIYLELHGIFCYARFITIMYVETVEKYPNTVIARRPPTKQSISILRLQIAYATLRNDIMGDIFLRSYVIWD